MYLNRMCGAFLLSIGAAVMGVCPAGADYMLHDFQDGTFGPFNLEGAPIVGAVIADNEPDFVGDRAALINDPNGGFQVVLVYPNATSILPQLHANDTIEWEVDSATYTGDFVNNFVVFQSNDPIGFNVLDGSNQFMNITTADQTYTHNYGAGEGRTILNTIDPDHDGDINEHGFTFFNVFVIQQAGDGQSSTLGYDDFRLTGEVIPEPTSVVLLALASAFVIGMRPACVHLRKL
jgi:hypothetical protein